MTAPVFQPPGDEPRASAKRDRAKPATSTGECSHCGGQNLPMRGRDIDEHHPHRIKGKRLGVPQIRVAQEDGWCPGSLRRAVPGTVERIPDTDRQRPYRGAAMPGTRRNQILRRDGAA